MYDKAWQLPDPEHSTPSDDAGHVNSPQAVPVAHASHVHVPAVLSQIPLFEHSVFTAWAVSAAVASSNHARDDEHVRNEQSGPVYPTSHVHTKVDAPLHVPCPLHA